MFFNRRTELKRLNERFQSNQAELLIMYGRRRVGKTELLQQFASDKPHLYFLADLSNDSDQLSQFTEKIRIFTDDSSLIDNPFATWHALFAYLKNLATNERLIVIIDEYQYLQSANKAMTSILQKAWDEYLIKTRIFLVLCGSYISFIENELLAYKSPLYGRRTGQFLIEPMNFLQSCEFFQEYSIEDQIRAYGLLGGIPAYLKQFNPQKGIEQNIENNFLYNDVFLFNEARFLLMEELKEPRNYFSILKTMAGGATKLNEIVQRCGLDRGMVAKYLDVLRNLKIISREVPITEKKPEKSRKGIYLILDNYLKFWFRFIMPNLSFVAENRQQYILKNRIMPQLDQFLGKVFEQVCTDLLKSLNAQNQLPFVFEKIGNYWNANQEIDIVAIDFEQENVLLAECKWSSKKVGTNILDSLLKKSAHLQTDFQFKKIHYALFSKSGFTREMQQLSRSDLLKFDLSSWEIETTSGTLAHYSLL